MDNTIPLTPALDIYEHNHQVVVLAEMPGVNNDNLDVEVNGKTLIIGGLITLDASDAKKKSHEEISALSYRRTLQLGDDLDSDKIDASFENGLLTLKMSKKAQSEPHRISVKFS